MSTDLLPRAVELIDARDFEAQLRDRVATDGGT